MTVSVDPDAVAERVLACPSVARLSAGTVEEVATYLPGRRVLGVRVGSEVEVHVVVRWGVPIPELAAEIRGAVDPVADGLPVSICVDDIELPPDDARPAKRSVRSRRPSATPSTRE